MFKRFFRALVWLVNETAVSGWKEDQKILRAVRNALDMNQVDPDSVIPERVMQLAAERDALILLRENIVDRDFWPFEKLDLSSVDLPPFINREKEQCQPLLNCLPGGN